MVPVRDRRGPNARPGRRPGHGGFPPKEPRTRTCPGSDKSRAALDAGHSSTRRSFRAASAQSAVRIFDRARNAYTSTPAPALNARKRLPRGSLRRMSPTSARSIPPARAGNAKPRRPPPPSHPNHPGQRKRSTISLSSNLSRAKRGLSREAAVLALAGRGSRRNTERRRKASGLYNR
jgi:hypothetical protein